MKDQPSQLPINELLASYLEDFQNAGVDRIPKFVPPAVSQPEAAVPLKNLPIEPTASRTLSCGETKRAETMDTDQPQIAESIAKIVQRLNPENLPTSRAEILAQLAEVNRTCSLCSELAACRTQTVFGDGNPNAELVFVGEGPGADEDAQGLPFVGRSGQLLTDIIVKGMKMSRSEVYICNIVRCRPPGNRNPSPVEAGNCRPFLDATLSVIAPKYICCLGAIAAHSLLGSEEPIGKMRGRVHDYRGAKVICTYHPAYLLRNPSAKTHTWEDIKLLLRVMGRMK